MKNKLLILTLTIISFGAGVFFESVKHYEGTYLCNPDITNFDEEDMTLRGYTKINNPFSEIPSWYNKKYLLDTKNFYTLNQSSSSDSSNLKASDVYSWTSPAYLELENGDIYDVRCSK